jgi:uncharacterized protein YjdB
MVALVNGQSVDLTVAYTDSGGASAPAPGAVTWSSSDDSIATVEANPDDDTQATAVSVAEGVATITAESGGIETTEDVDVSASEAVATEGAITAGAPYDTSSADQGLPGAQGSRLPGQQPKAPAPPRQVVRTTTTQRR